MKLTALAAAALLASTSLALAAPTHRGFPSPFTPFTPPHSAPAPLPVPRPIGKCLPSDTKCTIKAVIDVRPDLIAALTQADTTQAAVINAATGEAWDPYLHMCLMGTPAIGTAGQPGFVAAEGGLIAWLQNLQQPTLSSVPPLPADASVATIAEHARLLVIAGEQDVNTLVTTIQAGGFPVSIRQPCAGFLQDAFVTQPATIAGEVTVINSLFLKFMPK